MSSVKWCENDNLRLRVNETELERFHRLAHAISEFLAGVSQRTNNVGILVFSRIDRLGRDRWESDIKLRISVYLSGCENQLVVVGLA